MKFYKYILFVCLPLCSIAQDQSSFYSQINLANNLEKDGNIDSAIVVYEGAFTKVDYVQTHYLKKVLNLAVLKKDEDKITEYEQQINAQLKGKNPKLVGIIDSLFNEDQKVRGRKYSKALAYIKMKGEHPCKNSKKYIKSINLYRDWGKTDSSNVYCLLSLIEEVGFIGEELVGSRWHKVNILFLHFDRDTSNLLLEPILTNAVQNGEMLPLHATRILDRHLFTHTGTQKYWTWNVSQKGESLPFSDIDIPEILMLRENIGIYGSKLTQINKRNYWLNKNEFNF